MNTEKQDEKLRESYVRSFLGMCKAAFPQVHPDGFDELNVPLGEIMDRYADTRSQHVIDIPKNLT